MGYRRFKNPLNKAPLRTVTVGGNDPKYTKIPHFRLQKELWVMQFFNINWSGYLNVATMGGAPRGISLETIQPSTVPS